MFLDQIVATTRQSLAQREEQVTLAELESQLGNCVAPCDFVGALRGAALSLIAEIKKASPSKGWLSPDLDASSLAADYARGGAAAISVLTEPAFFHGSFADLAAVKEAVDLPVLCKDFILDPYQVYESRSYGADAVLLIAAILSQSELNALLKLSHQLGMSALVEVHNQQEIERALAAGARLIGINNRNLVDFSIDLETTFQLRRLIPAEIIAVCESGIRSHADVVSLQAVGVDAILVGEALVTSSDPVAKIRELLEGKTS